MSNLCSLPWCRRPIAHRKKSKKFPVDRPSQLAWLDALDAGAWFSIPPETLCTGLVLCENHFDSKGNIKRRYEVPDYCSSNVKLEPNSSDESDDDDEGSQEECVGGSYDSDYTPPTEDKSSSKKKGTSIKDVRVNVVRLKTSKRVTSKSKLDVAPSSSTRPKRARRKEIVTARSCSEDEEDGIGDDDYVSNSTCKNDTKLDSLNSDRLSELTSDALQRGALKNKSSFKGAKRNSCTLMQKMEVIRMVDRGMKQTQISKKLKMSKSTISQFIQTRHKIEEAFKSGAPLRKRIVRRSAFADVNETLYEWYEKMKSQNLSMNARVLLTMAENIASELGRTDFIPSSNWLSRFKEHYNIRFSSTPAKSRTKALDTPTTKNETNEKETGDDENDRNETNEDAKTNGVNENPTNEDEDAWLKKDWLENVWPEHRLKNRKTRELYSERDIFFVEELGILYRVTPKQAWQFRTGKNIDSLQDFSLTEERLTVLLCANSDGSEKRKLLIAGQHQSGLPSNLPASYIATSDPSNWFTKSTFASWSKSWNAMLQAQKRKIILVSNSSPIHTFASNLNLSNIKMVNIPTRLLSLLLPANFGVSTNFKCRYRRLLLERLIKHAGCRAVVCLDAIFMMSIAWNELPPDVIRIAFLQAGYFSSRDYPTVPEEDFNCSGLISKAAELDLAAPSSKYPFSEYVGIDNSLCAVECTVTTGGSETAPTEEDNFNEEALDNIEKCEGDGNVPVQCHLTSADAHNALDSLRLFSMSRGSCPQDVHNALNTIESFLLGHHD